MNNKLKNTLVALSLLICLVPESASAFPFKSNQQKKANPQVIYSQKNSFLSLFKPSISSRPQNTVGGAVRSSNCFQHLEKKQNMTALVPNIEQSITTKSHPEFFAYIPPMDGEKSAMFVVRDSTEDYYHSQNVFIPAEGGIIKINLSKDAPELEVGTKYDWFLQVHCTDRQKIDDPILEAQITRVSLTDSGSIMPEEESVYFFAQNEIWYDSLASAHQLMEDNSNSFYWQELIKSIGMEKLVTESNISLK